MEAAREAHGPPRDLLRDARPRRDPGVGRRAHGLPGRDAGDPRRRPDPTGRSAGRGAFQELDYVQVFGSLAKWVAQVDDAGLPELVARAFRRRRRGVRAGRARGARGCSRARRRRRRVAVRPRAGAPARTSSRSSAGCSRRRSDRSRSSVGSRGRAARRTSRALARGVRDPRRGSMALSGLCRQRVAATQATSGSDKDLGAHGAAPRGGRAARRRRAARDIETGFTTIPPPGTGRTLIHVHPDPDEPGRVYEPTLGIVASGPR